MKGKGGEWREEDGRVWADLSDEELRINAGEE